MRRRGAGRPTSGSSTTRWTSTRRCTRTCACTTRAIRRRRSCGRRSAGGTSSSTGDISKETPGSRLIDSLLVDDRPGPLYLLAWGGASTIARALKSIQERYQNTPQWNAVRAKVSSKAILSLSGDQDDTYADYIKPNWPDIRTHRAGFGGVAARVRRGRRRERGERGLLQRGLDARQRREQGSVRRALPAVGRRQADGEGRPLRLLRPRRSLGRLAEEARLLRLAAPATEGRVPRRRRHVHVSQLRRQRTRPAGTTRRPAAGQGMACRTASPRAPAAGADGIARRSSARAPARDRRHPIRTSSPRRRTSSPRASSGR